MEENVPEIDKETNRLAVVNLDWNQVQVIQTLSSFSVYIYFKMNHKMLNVNAKRQGGDSHRVELILC